MIKNLLQEGFALKNRGHYKHAIEVFYKALELDNTSSELLLEIADLYYKMQNEERALSYIEPYTSSAATGPDGWKFMGWKLFDDNGEKTELIPAVHKIACNYDNDQNTKQQQFIIIGGEEGNSFSSCS